MKMIQLLEHYNIKPTVSKYNTTKDIDETYSISCRDCNQYGKPCKGKQPSLDQYFCYMNPLYQEWATILNQPFTYSAENMGFYCFIHYISFILQDVTNTLIIIHDELNTSNHP